MTRTTIVAERRWIRLLEAVGLLLALVVLANVIDVGLSLVAAARGPEAPTERPSSLGADVAVPGAYHVQCAEAQPTLASRFNHTVREMLPARLIGAEGELPRCRRCGERIEPGNQMWIAAPD